MTVTSLIPGTEPHVLRPYNRSEALTVPEAAQIAGRSVRTIREWCLLHDIGRRIAGRWAVSRIALAMFLEGDRKALDAYLRGDRSSRAVLTYFAQYQVPLSSQRI